jgi:hypothetical protein
MKTTRSIAICLWLLPCLTILPAWTQSDQPAAQGAATHILGEAQDIGAIDADEIVIDYRRSPGRERLSYTLWESGSAFQVDGTGARIEPALVTALLSAGTGLHPAEEPQDCTSHTDDYPKFTLRLRRDGADIAELTSTSNCANHVPWNLVYEGRLLVQYDGSIWPKVHALLVAIDASTWRSKTPYDMGKGSIDVLPERGSGGGEPSDSLSARLVSLIGADSTYRARFGDAGLTVASARCKPNREPDCETLDVKARVAWKAGFAFKFAVRVNGAGPVEYMLPDDAIFATLDPFFASPIVGVFAELTTYSPITASFSIDTSRGFEWATQAAELSESTATLTRALFFVSVLPDNLPSVYFYPELGVAWILLRGDEQAGAYFKALGASEEIQAAGREGNGTFFVRLDGSIIWTE